MIQRSNVRRWVLMNGQMQVRIYQGGESRLGLLRLWEVDKWKQYQKQRTFPSTDTINVTARAMRLERSKQYNQQYGQNNAVRAIKAIQSTIRPEQCDQSNMTSDTIRTNPGMVTVTLPVALMQRPETCLMFRKLMKEDKK